MARGAYSTSGCMPNDASRQRHSARSRRAHGPHVTRIGPVLVQNAGPPAQGGVKGQVQASVLAQTDCKQCTLESAPVAQTVPPGHWLQSVTARQ